MYSVNSGYVGWSMSKRAAEAYEDGEMPKSKWTKAAMLAAIRDFCESTEDTRFPVLYDPSIEKMKKDEIFDRFFEYSSWHHTSKYFNMTDFYALDEDTVREALQDPKIYRTMLIEERLWRRDPASKYERECQRAADFELKRWKIHVGRIISPIEFIARYGKANGATVSYSHEWGDGIVVRFDDSIGNNPLKRRFFFKDRYDIDNSGMQPIVDLSRFNNLNEESKLTTENLDNRIAATRDYLCELVDLNMKCSEVVHRMGTAASSFMVKYNNPTVYQIAKKYPWMVTDIWESAKGNVCIRVEIPSDCLRRNNDSGVWSGTLSDAHTTRPMFLREGNLNHFACREIDKHMTNLDSIDWETLNDLPHDPKSPTPTSIAEAAKAEATRLSKDNKSQTTAKHH